MRKWKEAEKLKPPKKEKTPAELKAEEDRRKHVAKKGYLAYMCQCRQCLYRRGFLDEGGLLGDGHNHL